MDAEEGPLGPFFFGGAIFSLTRREVARGGAGEGESCNASAYLPRIECVSGVGRWRNAV